MDGETVTQADHTYTADGDDESAVMVVNGGSLALTGADITTSGDSSSSDSSSFYGLNAGVLATAGSTINMSDSRVVTSGAGANAVFATGDGASIAISDSTIVATGQYAHGVMATQGGTMTLLNVDLTTSGANSAPIATDRGGGTITVQGGTVMSAGADSPGLYSTGTLDVTGADITATGAEAAVIEGSNTITLSDTSLAGTVNWGVMIYQSISGDATGGHGTFTMTGGSLSAATGPLFYVTNSTGTIDLTEVTLQAASGTLLQAAAGRWGNTDSNGGIALLTAHAMDLAGDILVDDISSATITLQNGATLTGALNAADSGGTAYLTLDESSLWTVTADCYLTGLTDPAGISGTTITNIIGNGHTVYYDADDAANAALNGGTFTLVNGGILTPAA